VGSVITDGIDKIWQFEYDNAGTDYTELVWSVSGGGAGVETEQDDFRDGAVFQVRLLDNTDDSTQRKKPMETLEALDIFLMLTLHKVEQLHS
jgi:hypothetical protein